MLDDLRFISQVWSFEDCEAVEFIQLNVYGPDLINNLLIGLTGASAVQGGAINPSLDGRGANALAARNGFWMQPFKILTCRARSSSSSVLRSWNILQGR
jgi:hypothetical protein